MAIAFFSGCQNNAPRQELVQIKDIDYSPATKSTLVTVAHQGGCKNQNYKYEYQELDRNNIDKNLTYGLSVNTQGNCKKQNLQFIRMSLPQTSALPEQLIFQSSDNKKIIFTAPTSQRTKLTQVKLKSTQVISVVEDASFDQEHQAINFNIFVPDGCGEDYTHKYKIVEQNSVTNSASLALITEVFDKCDHGNYQRVKMPLPELSFQPDKLIFPVSEAKRIELTITSSQN